MIKCTFDLNNMPMSELKFGVIGFPAYSGMGRDRNHSASMCLRNLGPIPRGSYYIIDRESGGNKDKFGEILGEKIGRLLGLYRADWFALYAIDSQIDDEVFCDQLKRGKFRLHPASIQKISEGCVTIDRRRDWHRVKSILRASPPVAVPGRTFKAYGKLTVR